MTKLQYREDADEARERLTRWWKGENLGRPMLNLITLRETPHEILDVPPKPENWITHYSTSDYQYRLWSDLQGAASRTYMAEAFPFVSPDLGPGCLGLYLGCGREDGPDTVWIHECIDEDDPEAWEFKVDEQNEAWQTTLRLCNDFNTYGKGKVVQQFPDLVEGLDTLSAMRGNEELLFDLIERPEWVEESVNKITKLYFHYYDTLYDMMKDDVGGSHYWLWAPGRLSKLQCDFSAMISPEMFDRFMMPALREMTERIPYTLYHWDGPGALAHHDLLLSLDKLDMIQWTPGAGARGPMEPEWYPYYHKTFEAGKRVMIYGLDSVQDMQNLKKEFGDNVQSFYIVCDAKTEENAKAIIEAAYI